MAEVGLRDLGAFVPGRRGTEPVAPPLTPQSASFASDTPASSVLVTPPPPASTTRAVFGANPSTGPDTLGIDTPIARLAELAAHAGTAAPVCIGLLGGAGAGKSFALRRLSAGITDLATAAAEAGRGPYLSRIHIQAIDAATLESDPDSSLAAQVHAGLRQPYPALAREIGHLARDPHVVVRETNEKLDEARRRLDAERGTLDGSGSRLARLTETVLYDAAGSQVDSYARAHRASLENRLTAFGIGGDPIRDYKDLVRLVAEGGPVGLSLRSLHGFKGQTRLIVLAILFVLVGFGIGVAIETKDVWLGDLKAGPQAGATLATWLAAHIDLLSTARKAAYGLAVLAIVVNLWRAFNFLQPIVTGARLLRADLANRRRDLEGLYAHQTKRVDGLVSDVDRLTRAASEAEKRVGGSATHAVLGDHPSPFEVQGRAQAQNFFTTLGRLLREASTTPDAGAPQRIVLALDHLDAVPPERARAVLDTLHRTAIESGMLTLVAVDPSRLGTGLADLERWIQVPLRLDAKAESRDFTAFVQQALGRATATAAPAKPDATRSVLDRPVTDAEASLLATLAPLAGPSPGAVKRFVSLYAMARLDTDAHPGLVALMLALDQGGTQAERQAVAEATTGEDSGAAFDPKQTSARLRSALDAVEAAGGRVSKGDVATAAARAALFSVAAFA